MNKKETDTTLWIDTHAHVFSEKFDKDSESVVKSAISAGVGTILMPNIDLSSVKKMHHLADTFPEHCFPMLGLHPCSVDKNFETALAQLESYFSDRKYIAIGEIGTDLYWSDAFWEEQKNALTIQAGWAKQHDLPMVLHCRQSIDETIALFENLGESTYKGVFHCFTGDQTQAC